MKTVTIIIGLIFVLVCGCSQSPAPGYDYEGTWVDETIPLTLVVDAEQSGVYTCELSSGSTTYLNSAFQGQPDGSMAFAYDDGGIRQIEFIGAIDGDTLTGTFHHTGLFPVDYIVQMVRK